MMKIIRITESDLIKLVRRTIHEQDMQDEENSVKEFNEQMVYVHGGDSELVQKVLNELPNTIKFLSLRDCEGVDFSDLDICSFPNLIFVNLKGSPNNFEDMVECEYTSLGSSMYEIERD